MRQEGATAQTTTHTFRACGVPISAVLPHLHPVPCQDLHLAASSSAHRSICACTSKHHTPMMAPSNALVPFLSIFRKFCFPRVDNRHSSWPCHCCISLKHTRTSIAYLRMKRVCWRLAWYADDRLLSMTCVRKATVTTTVENVPCPTVGSLDSKRKCLPSPEIPRHLSLPRF